MLPTFTYQVEAPYYKPELFEDILNHLDEQDIDFNRVSRSHIHGVDEFHVRGAEVSKELVRDLGLSVSTVLDVGCGIGGPARMLADELNCMVTGADLSAEYIRTAQRLSEFVGLNDNTRFNQADALEIPFKDGSFDVVWTQHVLMGESTIEKLINILYGLEDEKLALQSGVYCA